jgi:hypothetical protein
MVTAVNANLERLFEFAFVEMSFAAITLDEDILRLDYALFGRNSLDLFTLFAEPGHTELALH